MTEQSTLTGLGMRFSYMRDKSYTNASLKAGIRDLKIRNQCKINNVVRFAYILDYIQNLETTIVCIYPCSR